MAKKKNLLQANTMPTFEQWESFVGKTEEVRRRVAVELKKRKDAFLMDPATTLSEMQNWIESLGKKKITTPTTIIPKENRWAKLWREFYQHDFPEIYQKYQSEFDFSKVDIPPASQEYVGRLILPRLSIINNECALTGGKVPYNISHRYYNDMDKSLKSIGRNNPEEWDKPYAIRYRFYGEESDPDMKDRSAEWVAEQGIDTMNFRERAILGRFYMCYGNLILDQSTVNLLASSRHSDGCVPYLYRRDSGVRVDWSHPRHADARLRARRVVSF